MSFKITIGIPCNRQFKSKTVECLLNLISHSKHEFHFVIATEGYTISENRAYIVAQASKNKSDYLLFIDDDMVFESGTLDRLLACKKDIVGVSANSRKLPLQSTVELMEKGKMPKELFRAKAVGAGIMLIDMGVFDHIQKPYFATETHEIGFTQMGEDSWFCRQADKKNIETWCDPTIKVGHLGDYEY